MRVINDPVHGFITADGLILKLIDLPIFQRLRRIKQLALVEYIYPSANHTRFSHALGAMHLMSRALNSLRSKKIRISEAEYEASLSAILLHDIGHTPFSHTLEAVLLTNIKHEAVSLKLMRRLNQDLGGALDLALKIFENQYERAFFYQLISGQFDTDRLDYLARDAYFTNVQEGKLNLDRLLLNLNVIDDQLVIEEKGKYTLEHFLNARRLMYWQVYFHKTNIAMEALLQNIIKRVKVLYAETPQISMTQALNDFFRHTSANPNLILNEELLDYSLALDDYDIWHLIKSNTQNDDFCLSQLCRCLIKRKVFKTLIYDEPFETDFITETVDKIQKQHGLSAAEVPYFYKLGALENTFYTTQNNQIFIKVNDKTSLPFNKIADFQYITSLLQIRKKYYFVYPK